MIPQNNVSSHVDMSPRSSASPIHPQLPGGRLFMLQQGGPMHLFRLVEIDGRSSAEHARRQTNKTKKELPPSSPPMQAPEQGYI
jgi:hypothetical protein